MPAYMKLGDIKGEATEQSHKDWVIIDSMSSPVVRSIPAVAKDMNRARGETRLGDVVVVRNLDQSSVKLQEACANGTFFKEVEIHFCTQVKGKQVTYLSYKLFDVIVSSYSFHGTSSGNPLPSEECTLGPSKAEWTYTVIDPNTGEKKGQVLGKFNPAEGKS